MRIRQVALIAQDLEKTIQQVQESLGIAVSFRDPGVEVFGLANAVFPIGETFLEVVSPETEDSAGRRYLDRRGGDSGYMVMLQTEDLAADRTRVAAAEFRVAWEVALDDAAAIHLHPKDTGGAILSFDQMAERSAWRWAGPDWRSHMRTDRVCEIVGVDLEAAKPEVLAQRWSRALGIPVLNVSDKLEIPLAGGVLRFEHGASDEGAIRAVELRVADPRAWRDVEICGVAFRSAHSADSP